MNHVPNQISLPEGWEAEIYRDWNFPAEVIERWKTLAERQGDMGLFVGAGWFESWSKAFGSKEKLLIMILKKEGETKAIFPCCIDSSSEESPKRIGSLTNDHTCYYDFIIEAETREEALAHFMGVLRRLTSHEVFFEYIPSSGENVNSFLRLLRHHWTPFHIYSGPWAPWLELSGDWERFSSALPGRLRNTLKRCRKKAEEKGKLQFEVIRESQQLDDILDVLFEIESRSWKGKGGTAMKSDPEAERFYRELAHWAMTEGCLFLFLLKLDGVPIAGSFCLSSGKTVFLLKPGYDDSFSALSPGSLLQAEVLKYLFMLPEISVYNFLGACDRWKTEWTSTAGNVGSLKVYPRSLNGWGRYVLKYGWKDLLKRSPAFRRAKNNIDSKELSS
ncbi:MAG: GNAT family N-acetyltransferase [Nitrospirae bacterium]|nr:GNAT family N-acetyltransferase [Candidatus Manganitrophaceae bacterium]